jgi:undecaprenyl phosphate-alpha-L-ara4N flippase subunit ArnE
MTVRLLWFLLLAFPVGVGAGQVLLKIAAQRMQPGVSLATVSDPLLWLAAGLYGALGVIWILILKQIPLSTAYPFVAVSFAVTPLLGWLLLGDKPAGLYFVGIGLICAGVAITQRAVHAG